MAVFDVTSGVTYATLSAAITGSSANDVLWLDVGSYVEDFPDITHNLTIEVNPNAAQIGLASLSNPQPLPPNGRAVLNVPGDKNVNLSVAGLEIFGANNDVLGNSNGAGILFETGNGTLTVDNCWIHHNEDGILTGGTNAFDPQGMTIEITNSQIDHNGAPINNPRYGFDHNVYIGAATSFIATGNSFHDALGGHEIKTAALSNTITGNQIIDGPTAETSYSVDLPFGGATVISNNTFEKGASSQNKYFIHYGSSQTYPGSSLQITGNTVTNTRSSGAIFLLNQSYGPSGAIIPATITGNNFVNINREFAAEDQKWNGGFYAPTATVDIISGNVFPNACFQAGTRILTLRGHIAVEKLAVGDGIVLRRGSVAPVRWIGHRTVDCTRHPQPTEVRPVRVIAGAFGPGMPLADLLLSPDHAVHADGVLIPVRYLLNGRSVRQEAASLVTYYHIELPAHDVLLAEGLPCESYLDTGNRSAFANGGPAMQLHPDLASGIWSTRACAPMAIGGPVVTEVRRRLLARAADLGFALTADPAPVIEAGGQRVTPTGDDRLLRFVLPPGCETARLLSRVSVPADTCADRDDHRRLGIAIARLWLDGVPVALDDPRFGAGWYKPEQDDAGETWRWTSGAAVLAAGGAREIIVEVAMTEQYWVDAQPRPTTGRAIRRRT
ncbi:MAG: Hint domain-containing protein [Alphaproteobacteria bacterium]|nr:Hint domain-containing protein [Alphaproteobacteria bacterium]